MKRIMPVKLPYRQTKIIQQVTFLKKIDLQQKQVISDNNKKRIKLLFKGVIGGYNGQKI